MAIIQGDQLNMAMSFRYTLYKVTCPVYATVHVNTGQVTFYSMPEKHGHFLLVTMYHKELA